MPTIIVLGGANGAGKTTFYEAAIKNAVIDPAIPYLNVDMVARNEMGGYSAANLHAAEQIVKERLALLIEGRKDFMIESNLAKSSEFEWLEKLNKLGYDISLEYFSLGDIELNKDRVHNRVAEGGHDVPDHIIEQRASMGITYLKSKIFLFKKARLIDNASGRHTEVAICEYGKIIKRSPDCPAWANDILSLADKLLQKKNRRVEEPKSPYHKLKPKGRGL